MAYFDREVTDGSDVLTAAGPSVILDAPTVRVEYFQSGAKPSHAVAFTFTYWGFRDLEGDGYGTRFLLQEGFDVIAFKSSLDDWFQAVPQEWFAQIRAFLAPLRHRRRVAYGSSMGGYAAIQFSRELRCDTVLAYSPQYRIDQDFDTTWAKWAEEIQFRYFITPDCIAPACQYFVLCDSRDSDIRHVERIRAVIAPDRFTLRTLPWAGHPVDVYLSEIGLLKSVALQALVDNRLDGLALRRDKGLSKSYLGNLAQALWFRNKNALALEVIDRALALQPDEPNFQSLRVGLLERLDRSPESDASVLETLLKRSRYLEVLGLHEAAVERLREAIQWLGTRPLDEPLSLIGARVHLQLSFLLTSSGGAAEALPLVDAALALDPRNAAAHGHRAALLEQLGDLWDALAAVCRAVSLDPHDAEIREYLEHLLARVGREPAA